MSLMGHRISYTPTQKRNLTLSMWPTNTRVFAAGNEDPGLKRPEILRLVTALLLNFTNNSLQKPNLMDKNLPKNVCPWNEAFKGWVRIYTHFGGGSETPFSS